MDKLRPLLTPKSFSNDREEDIEDFFDYFERVSSANGWDENDNLIYLYFYLEGCARKYFEVISNELKDKNNLKFSTVKEKLLKYFRSPLKIDKLEFELNNCRMQPQEDAKNFVVRVLFLCNKLDSNMHEKRIIKFILKGLSSEILERIVMLENSTIEKLINNLEKFELSRYLLNNQCSFSQVKEDLKQNQTLLDLERKIDHLLENQNCIDENEFYNDINELSQVCNYA
ncbi:hypothetical protein LSTR_LSTR013140 [Laodelphax striatellus]|uniref:Retrotransposon gag domain-containing protein n=1 Tax=Laodelphax striatellus TaxID=195883 RepID=A0A482XDL7_LAOST|nr:hypothetical protein LSTR_LSTR013140 [Laodelphax striatellus]